jgi:hypothetical protein
LTGGQVFFHASVRRYARVLGRKGKYLGKEISHRRLGAKILPRGGEAPWTDFAALEKIISLSLKSYI